MYHEYICVCSLDDKGDLKVSDFGLSEDIYSTEYCRLKKNEAVALPFKWMAPESLRDTIFTMKSDVVSYCCCGVRENNSHN